MSIQNRKKIVRQIFKLIMKGKQKEGLLFFAPKARQHNPYVKGGMEQLFDAMSAVQSEAPKYPDPYFAIKKVIAEGNMVAVHTEMQNSRAKPSEGGLRQVHLFRFNSSDKIVEYWDLTQTIEPDMPNAANAFE
jgi:predicted SnoaL-like aldol condensation-catalyzing enzyme